MKLISSQDLFLCDVSLQERWISYLDWSFILTSFEEHKIYLVNKHEFM